MARHKKEEIQRAAAAIRQHVQKGDQIWILLRHATGSGTRYYDVYVIKNNELLRITWDVGVVAGYTYNYNRDALVVKGYGFSGADDIADSLGHSLFGGRDGIRYREF